MVSPWPSDDEAMVSGQLPGWACLKLIQRLHGAIWCCKSYLQSWAIFGVNVAKSHIFCGMVDDRRNFAHWQCFRIQRKGPWGLKIAPGAPTWRPTKCRNWKAKRHTKISNSLRSSTAKIGRKPQHHQLKVYPNGRICGCPPALNTDSPLRLNRFLGHRPIKRSHHRAML